MSKPSPVRDRSTVVRSSVVEEGVLVLMLQGELDADNSTDLHHEVRRQLRSWDGPLVLDMSAVSFLDSSAISCLLRLRNDIGGPARTVTLRSAAPNVRRVLTIVGMVDVFGLS
jgi:anti-sigma B factor antagonist